MKLRSGTPYWRAIDTHRLPSPPLRAHVDCEVAVIGGGITGALAAYFLVKEGVSTVLLDRGEFAMGSTAASTGLLQHEVDTPLVDLIRKVGRDHAVHAYRRGLRAIDELEQLTAAVAEPCGFSRRSSLYFASHWWHARRLRTEYECRKEHGFDLRWLNRQELRSATSIDAAAATLSAGDAQIDPYRFTLALIERAQAAGLLAFGQTDVRDIEERADGLLLKTAGGSIAAQRIVFATGYEAGKRLTPSVGRLRSTYAVASAPLGDVPGWPDQCLIWETSRPYFYARRTDDGRAIIGGEDTAFAQDHRLDWLLAKRVGRLQRRFEKLFPGCNFEPAYAWGGTFGETKDGLAYIGLPAARPKEYFALGYGGNGITFGVIAARLIADLYLRRSNPDEQVFRFGR